MVKNQCDFNDDKIKTHLGLPKGSKLIIYYREKAQWRLNSIAGKRTLMNPKAEVLRWLKQEYEENKKMIAKTKMNKSTKSLKKFQANR